MVATVAEEGQTGNNFTKAESIMNGGRVVASSWRYKQIDQKLLTFQSERLIRNGKQKSKIQEFV